ncbi:MAG: hypothetical protein ABIS67_09720 [Candidatus Eisenbacteria bacterium]
MKRISYPTLAFLASAALVATVATSHATPIPNSAIVLERLYNDCPPSTVTSVNTFPAFISISDSWNSLCVGYANGHAWDFSGDGVNPLNLGNNGSYKFKSTVTVTATSGVVEGGIHIAPWWNNMDGRFQVRIPDGEVVAFGPRLPFYSFTSNHGVVYVPGTPIIMEIEYLANGLSSASPASIQYRVTYGGPTYTSPVLFFDQGNPSEDPPHGQWGSLDPSYAGGVTQVNNGSAGSNYRVTWGENRFDCLDCAVPVRNASWGRVKVLYR